jgi:hypothetical protein
MSTRTIEQLRTLLDGRSTGSDGIYDLLQAIRGQCLCRVPGDNDTEFVTTDGASQTITVYEIDVAAGDVLLNGVHDAVAAEDDSDLLNQDILSFALDGTDAVALTADGQTYEVALCCISISDAATLVAIFGDEAADTAEVKPTGAQCFDAIVLADPTGWDGKPGVIVTRFKIQRVATDTITMTHADPASDELVKSERLAGNVF